MVNELNALESKIGQVVSLCRALQTENNLLRQQLVAADAEKQGLAERTETACRQIEQLIQQLPEAKTTV
ncbi:MAG: hypothetical protein LBU43_08240 [Candidatus Accumulibacter sp.]|jgi:cell division protein ZapB|nr:hypothetical protein [Accumulibacter sp.]